MTNPPDKYQANEERYVNGMVYKRCGQSGILLPKISLGFWHNFGAVDSYDNCRAIARYAFDHGITHFDLANNYGPPYGSAEETLGRLIEEDFRPYRDELFIATKAGYDMWPGPYGNWGSRKYLMASLDQSLHRMKLDYVDLFYSHRYDPVTPLEETLQALVDIVKSGKALYVGISRWPLAALKTAFCQQEGVGFISFSPLAQGLLTDRYLNGIPEDSRMQREKFLRREMLTDDLLRHLHQLNNEAAAQGQSLAEYALSWVLKHRGITSVLIGASSTKQLERNLMALKQRPAASSH